MAYGELYIPVKRPDRNVKTGRFMKGSVPHNKGKKWSDYMGKRAMKRCAKGWKNISEHRPKHRPDLAGRFCKQVIAVDCEGKWFHFSCSATAAKWICGNRENVGRCCRCNQARHVNKKTGAINTDHKYMGVRFYFEEDNIWTEKIKQ